MKQFFKRAFYSFTGLPLVHYLGRPWRGRACVLCYHRVMPDDEIETVKNPNSNLIVPTSRFAEQMSFLAENHEVVSMDELVSYLESEPYGDLKKFVVAVTFDDGYKDNLIHALPFLEQYNIPATIYITTRFPEGDTWMWWYEIWEIVNRVNSLVFKHLDNTYELPCNNKTNIMTSYNFLMNTFIIHYLCRTNKRNISRTLKYIKW